MREAIHEGRAVIALPAESFCFRVPLSPLIEVERIECEDHPADGIAMTTVHPVKLSVTAHGNVSFPLGEVSVL